ncbi:hypothetical protein [Streptomyces sp. NPDC060366]|uniref:hypothetical protein n=1 Tax=Streptomyces sp. NPDC060366 TaxID=3347105 RepID=UPI00364B2330
MGRDATPLDVSLFVHCDLGGHLEGDHAAPVLFVPEPSGLAAWVRWHEQKSCVQLMDPCTERNPAGDICLLFSEHPGDHLFPEETNTPTAQGG